ncbi:MAG: hypothetical protein KF832_03265 [Caldilineaceae bacterium]|nr:hypothetical protein [Caldilineaceae bacterium]
MTTWNYTLPWYHGSQQELTVLRTGSSITQNREIARVFSHRPAILAMEDDGTFRHNGTDAGYLYRIDEVIQPEDVYPHPHPINASRWEWLTTREIKVRLIERPPLREAERLTEAYLAELRRRQAAAGAATFAT